MKQAWSITESIYVYYSYDGERVFLANPEAKKYYGVVKKIAESKKDPEVIKNDGAQIKFCDGKVKIFLKKWYTIGNVYTEDIFPQLSLVTIINGDISGVIFGFNPVYPEKVLTLFPGSDLYKESEKEFVRKTNLSLYTKTTKYTPGHKYESDNGTLIYLGPVYSHKSDMGACKRFSTAASAVRKLNAFINDLPENPDYENILKENRIIELNMYPEEIKEKTIFLVARNKSMADLGEVVKISKDFEDVWEARIKKFISEKKEPYSYGSSLYHYSDIDELIQFFNASNEMVPNVSDESKKLMKDIVKVEFRYYLYKYFDTRVQEGSMNIISGHPIDSQVHALVNNLIISGIRDSNYYSFDYYVELFKTLFDINLNTEAENSLASYKLMTVSTSDYQDLIDNFGYLEFRAPENYIKKIDFVYTNEEKRSFEAFLEKGFYCDTIKDIYQNALKTNGVDLGEFSISNVGSSKAPEFEYLFSITLEDLKNYFGVDSIQNLPVNFKKEMLKNKIYKVIIKTRDNIKLKS